MKTTEFIELYCTDEIEDLIDVLEITVIESEFFPGNLKSLLCCHKKPIIYIDIRMKQEEKKFCLLLQIGRWLRDQNILDKDQTAEKFVCDWVEKKIGK